MISIKRGEKWRRVDMLERTNQLSNNYPFILKLYFEKNKNLLKSPPSLNVMLIFLLLNHMGQGISMIPTG
ncbi:hypothetical protein CS542_07745 [Pedobacter sp. IW39]|nr:hypothetical protein CS542_07745 [Pedobacter sp. IW39]